MNKKGSILVLVIIISVVLAILGSALLQRSINENNLAQKYLDSARAFWLAESGVNKALDNLRNNVSSNGGETFGDGEYEYTVTADGGNWKVTAYGYVPLKSSYRIMHKVETTMSKGIPLNFYDYPIYSAGDVDFNGSSFSIENDALGKAVLYGGDKEIEHPENISGSIVPGDSVLPRLNFEDVLEWSQGQTDTYAVTGNVYDVSKSGKLVDPITKAEKALPATFWYIVDDIDGDGEVDDDENWVPNVCYINGDLSLKGTIGSVGGFLVVVGNVITNPDNIQDAEINGNGLIEGAIYTRGEFRVNGGGTGLNINGGVWGGTEIRLNGNADITYDEEYMNAIKGLEIEPEHQIIAWKDLQNPYPLTP